MKEITEFYNEDAATRPSFSVLSIKQRRELWRYRDYQSKLPKEFSAKSRGDVQKLVDYNPIEVTHNHIIIIYFVALTLPS